MCTLYTMYIVCIIHTYIHITYIPMQYAVCSMQYRALDSRTSVYEPWNKMVYIYLVI